MAEDLQIARGTKTQQYTALLPQIRALTEGETDPTANLANITAALKEQFGWLWVGFYLVKAGELVVGPFQGPIACTRIRKGKGVCGTSWAEERTLIVPDVEAFPGHIACSSLSRSEIVVPIRSGEAIVGVLDVDSIELNAFDQEDQRWLEDVVKIIPASTHKSESVSLRRNYFKSHMSKKLIVFGLVTFVLAASAAPLQGGNVPPSAVILGRKEVPILCYHQIRDWKPTDSKVSKDYIMPPADLKAELKMLHDSGYHTILPDQLYAYLTKGAALPSKPIMLTFDDTDEDQYAVAWPEMKKYGFRGVFFIMTISLNKLPHYMTVAQVKELYAAGNVLGSHTWDHHNVKKYQGKDWEIQIDKPTKQLEAITGTKINYFAYPFGLWNPQALPELRKRGFIMAFQLADKMDRNDPLMTVRRIIVGGGWSLKTFDAAIKRDFH